MEKELDVYFPTVIGEIIASYLQKFKGNSHLFPNKNILNHNTIHNNKIYTYNHETVYVLDLEGNLLFSSTFNYVNYFQVLKDGNLLVISDTRLYVYDTTKWLQITAKSINPSSMNYHPHMFSESNFYYRIVRYEKHIKIYRVNPYTGQELGTRINVTKYLFQITEYGDSFFINTEKTIYFVTGKRVKEIPTFGKIVSYVNITEGGLLYYVSSTEENYYLTFSDGKMIKLSLDRELHVKKEIILLMNRIFLIAIDIKNSIENIMVLDIDNGRLIYSKQGDRIRMIGLLSGYFGYTYYQDGSNIDLIKIGNGEIVTTHSMKNASYIDMTTDDRLVFLGNNDVIILS